MDKYEIAVLADDYHSKREHFRYLGMSNYPTDPVKARERTIAYHLAEAELFEAMMRLEAAKMSPLQKIK